MLPYTTRKIIDDIIEEIDTLMASSVHKPYYLKSKIKLLIDDIENIYELGIQKGSKELIHIHNHFHYLSDNDLCKRQVTDEEWDQFYESIIKPRGEEDGNQNI